MVAAKPAVPWHLNRAIVAFKIPMVKLVKEVAHLGAIFLADVKLLKPRVAEDRMHGLHIAMKGEVNWMAWYDEVDCETAEIHQVFNRMHREAGPWTHIDVFMM